MTQTWSTVVESIESVEEGLLHAHNIFQHVLTWLEDAFKQFLQFFQYMLGDF